ncbi:hypothetical protein [Roseateles oligotrophus]|uniref:Uncharacterized protein n=1 Tax=Roseateles oligotrophus TaxID=1769250 RepID=A0ABT2YK59_9BURK|nr:hypothetical protein [Roseateles oligotrophus]MCV2370449.1 hypothetical protein [Roseateles oligotrophus]
MNSSSLNYLQSAQAQPRPAPSSFFCAPRLLLNRWLETWATRAEARWKTTDLRSRYY